MARRKPPTVHGLVVVDKPAGMTSHDVVAQLRKSLKEKRVGHAGTLDPDATGVLVVGVGNATRLMRFMSGMDKEYVAQIVFGSETDTLDSAGAVTQTYAMSPPDLVETQRIINAQFVGDILQIPPMVSALRVDGKRLHQLAREGIEVDRAPRPVHVHEFNVSATADPMVLQATVRCGSGTYIRSLGADLGTALGGGAHIRALQRTSVGPFGLSDACSLDEPVLQNVLTAVREMEQVTLDADGIDNVLYGRPLPSWDGTGPWAILNEAGELIAVYEKWKNDLAKPTVVFGGR